MWYQEGYPIKRLPLRALFTSALKREGDDYFLLTPVEKWQITLDRQVFSLNQMMDFEDDDVYYLEFRNEIGQFFVLMPIILSDLKSMAIRACRVSKCVMA